MHRCGLPESLVMGAECAMPITKIYVRVPVGWGGFSWEETRDAFARGVKIWSDVVQIDFVIERDPISTHISPSFAGIDGRGNVLAWSQLPCPWSPPIIQRYDSSESYTLAIRESGKISIPLLVCHEVGHALGLGHGPSGNIMGPYLRDDITELGPWDLAEIKKRYKPRETPPPGDGDMQKLFACLFKVLPTFLECVFQEEEEARKVNEEGPITALLRLLSGK